MLKEGYNKIAPPVQVSWIDDDVNIYIYSLVRGNNSIFFIKVNLQAAQKVRVGLDLTVDKIHLDELDNTLGIHVHIKVYINPTTGIILPVPSWLKIDTSCHCLCHCDL